MIKTIYLILSYLYLRGRAQHLSSMNTWWFGRQHFGSLEPLTEGSAVEYLVVSSFEPPEQKGSTFGSAVSHLAKMPLSVASNPWQDDQQ